MAASRQMTFSRRGRSYHLRIQTAEDLENILDLDEAHWVATGAPIETINCDATFLDLVDTDSNSRIMCYELVDAVRWLNDVLAECTGVTQKSTTLKLDALNDDSADGRSIRQSAEKILTQSRAASDEVTLEQVREVKRQVAETPVSEAGVVLPEASEDEEIRGFIADILATVGGAPHPSGTDGVNTEKLGKFLADADAYLDWLAKADVPKGKSQTDIMPLGDDTHAAFDALCVLRDKVDQYFTQSRAVALDPSLAKRMGATEAELDSLDLDDIDVLEKVLAEAPLSEPTAERTLSLTAKVNPHYAESLETLCDDVIKPVLGDSTETLTEEDWENLKTTFAPHAAWVDEKPSDAVEKIGDAKLRDYLDDRFRAAVEALIAESGNTAYVLDNIRLTEKLILYQAHLIHLANNFVSFPDLYDEDRRAMFEMGTLICDGRRFNMAVRVRDRAEHSAVTRTSNMYVMYVEITSRDNVEKIEVAVPVTSGGRGNLCVGKRGVFEDTNGDEWDARVVQIIENPISLGEALVSPFRRIARALTGKIESITTKAEKRLDTTVVKGAKEKQAPVKPAGGLAAGGLLMGGGVAIAALGSALAYVTKTLSNLKPEQVIAGVVVAILAVLVPISIMAFVKLRRRDLSAILEGSGWAVNARMRLTRKQARFFSRRPAYPLTAKGIRRRTKWIVIAIVLAVLAAATASISLF